MADTDTQQGETFRICSTNNKYFSGRYILSDIDLDNLPDVEMSEVETLKVSASFLRLWGFGWVCGLRL